MSIRARTYSALLLTVDVGLWLIVIALLVYHFILHLI